MSRVRHLSLLLIHPSRTTFAHPSIPPTQSTEQPNSFHCYSYIHRPSETFPPMPWFVKIMCNWIFYWPERNMWRFAPELNYGVTYSMCTFLLDFYCM